MPNYTSESLLVAIFYQNILFSYIYLILSKFHIVQTPASFRLLSSCKNTKNSESTKSKKRDLVPINPILEGGYFMYVGWGVAKLP